MKMIQSRFDLGDKVRVAGGHNKNAVGEITAIEYSSKGILVVLRQKDGRSLREHETNVGVAV